MLLTVESSAFADSMLTALKCQEDITTFAVSVELPDSKKSSLWSAFIIHSTNQMFLTSQSSLPLCKQSLVAVLDMAEQLGVHEAFVCVLRDMPESAVLVSEFTSMGFKHLSPRLQPVVDFTVLRFDF